MSDEIEEHLGYLSDPVRLETYRNAIGRKVEHDARVVDLGCGTGILGLLCLQAGAAEVLAVDSTAMIEVARSSFRRAGLADKATFIHGHSNRAVLSERVDLVVCDQVGYFGFDAGIVQYLEDAIRRHLKPGGATIPSRIRLMAAGVESASHYASVAGWDATPLEFRWLRDAAVNHKYAVNVQRDEILAPPVPLGEIVFSQDIPDLLTWNVDLRVARDGLLHGIAGWFECELAEDVWMTNSPLAEKPIRRFQAFFPIAEAQPVRAGEAIKLTVMARPRDGLIAWIVELATGRRFSHSTWQGQPFTQDDLHRLSPTHVPQPTPEGRARATVLSYCDGQRSVREIEQAVLREHPDLLPSTAEISRFVAHVLGRDTA